MAIACAGVTVTWGGTALKEVVEVSVTSGGSLPIARSSTWTYDVGTIQIAALSSTAMSSQEYGKKQTLTFSGGGLYHSFKAICQGWQTVGTVNDVTRYSATFKIALD